MEAEVRAILQKRRQCVRGAYDRLILAEPNAERCLALQQECATALQADAKTINELIVQHRKVIGRFVDARLTDFDTKKDQSFPDEAILENQLVEYLQLLREQLLRQTPYRTLQELLQPYGITLYDTVMHAVEKAAKKTNLSPYRISYAELQQQFSVLPPYVLCTVIAAARLRQLDEEYLYQKDKKNEAGMVLQEITAEVRRCLKKALIRFCDPVGSKGNPIIVPNKDAAVEVLGILRPLSGRSMRWCETERITNLLVYQVNDCYYNPVKKKTLCFKKHWLYFRVVPEAKMPDMPFYPPGFWRRDGEK